MKILIDKGIVKRGRTYNLVVRDRILRIMEEIPISTPQRIKEKYEEAFHKSISWNTISARLTELVSEKKIHMVQTTIKENIKGKHRTRINRIYSLKPFK